jgi:hypothetical protein
MSVVCHQHIGVNATAISHRAFQKAVQIGLIVPVCEKTGCAVVYAESRVAVHLLDLHGFYGASFSSVYKEYFIAELRNRATAPIFYRY